MNTKFEKGAIVKFINSNDVMDGGTIVSIVREGDGTEYAMINTLEGAKIKIKVEKLISIKHQRKGVVSDKFKKRISKEINEYNQKLISPTAAHCIPGAVPNIAYTPQQLDIKLLKEKVASLENENEKLRKEIEEVRCPYETKMLIRTVKALKQSISDGIILSDDKSSSILPLLDLIMEFNNIQEDKKE